MIMRCQAGGFITSPPCDIPIRLQLQTAVIAIVSSLLYFEATPRAILKHQTAAGFAEVRLIAVGFSTSMTLDNDLYS